MIETFHQALFTEPPRILGIQLKKFSLIHHFALKALENPVMFMGVDWEKVDLLSACLVCSRGYSEIGPTFFGHANRFESLISIYSGHLSEVSAEEWIEARDAFVSYMEVYSLFPEHWATSEQKSIRHPWEWLIALELLKNGVASTRAEAWDTACNEAHCWYSTIGESMGDDSLETDEEQDIENTARDTIDLFNPKNYMTKGKNGKS